MERIRRERDHKAMIQDPRLWPRWPILPVKRRGDCSNVEVGLIIAATGLYAKEGPVTVVIGNLYMFRAQDLPSAEKVVYQSVDELLGAGWVVD